MFASLLCCLGKVPPEYENATGDSYIQRPAVNKDVDSESRDSKNSQSSLESAGCRVIQKTQTCRSLDKKNTEVSQTQKVPVQQQREPYIGAASKQKVHVTPEKGNADSDRHALLQTVSVCRHVQNTELLQQRVHLDVLPLRLKSGNNSSPDSNDSSLNHTKHADLTSFQSDCFTFTRSRNVQELPAVLPSRFRFRSLSSISHTKSQDDIYCASGSLHASTSYGADTVKTNNRFLHSFKDPLCDRNPDPTTPTTPGPTTATTTGPTTATTTGPTTPTTTGPTTATTTGPTTPTTTGPTTATTAGPTTATTAGPTTPTTTGPTTPTTAGPTTATTPICTTAGIYDPIDAKTSSPTKAGTLDHRAMRNPDPTAGMHPTVGKNTRIQKLTLEGLNIAAHRRTCLEKTWHINDSSWTEVSGAGSHLTKTDNWSVSEFKHNQPSNWSVSEFKHKQPSNFASLKSTATEQAACFKTGDTFQRPWPIAPDNSEIAATPGYQKAVGTERTDKGGFSWGYVVKEKLLLPSAIRQGVNPFQTAPVVVPELDIPLVPKRLTENGTTDVGTDLASLEDTVEPRQPRRQFSEESTAVASCHAEIWRVVVNISSLDVDRSQQSPTHPVDESSSFGGRGGLEIGKISRSQAIQQENFPNYITWSGSDVSDTLSIVTEVPEPCLHGNHFHRGLQLDSNACFEDSTFDDSTVDCALDDSSVDCSLCDSTVDCSLCESPADCSLRDSKVDCSLCDSPVDFSLRDNAVDDDLSECHSHNFKSADATGESSVGASDRNNRSTTRVHRKNTGSKVPRMQHHLPVESQQNIQQSIYSARHLRGSVERGLGYEDLTNAWHMFQHLDKGVATAHRTSRSQELPREDQPKVSEPLVNWPVLEEKIKSDNVTHELDKQINKSDHNSSMSSLIDSPGKSAPGGKPTLLSLANKGKKQEKSQLPESTSVKGVAATTVNRTAQHLQKPGQARKDSRATLFLHDSSSGRQVQDSGICVLMLTVLAPTLIFNFK
ncbi:hypothetical protein BsWGS_26391 [Bradybaena similaris]